MSIAEWMLLFSLFGLMGVFLIKLYRVMSAIGMTEKKEKELYDFRFFVIEMVVALFAWFLNLASNLTLLTLFSSWMFKIAVFLLSLTTILFVSEIFIFGKKFIA